MPSIGTLAAKLTLSSKGFTSGISSAAQGLKSFIGRVTGAIGTIGGLGTLLSAGGIIYGLKNIIGDMDTLGKMSDRLGMTTEALGGLEYAAKLTDVASELLTGSITKMQRAIAEGIHGGKEQMESFKRLGLSLGNLAGMKTEEQFYAIVDALSKITNPAERAAMAMRVFGKSAPGMLPLIISGAQEIRNAVVEAKELGITFSRDVAVKAEMFNDNMTRVWEVVKGIGITLATELLPYLVAGSEAVVNWAKSSSGAGGVIGDVFRYITERVLDLVDALDTLFTFEAKTAFVERRFLFLAQNFPFLTSAVGLAIEGWGFDVEAFGKLLEADIKNMDSRLAAAIAGRREDLGAKWGAMLADINRRAGEIAVSAPKFTALEMPDLEAAKQLADQKKLAEKLADVYETPAEKLKQQMDEVFALRGVLDPTIYNRALADIKTKAEKLGQPELTGKAEELRSWQYVSVGYERAGKRKTELAPEPQQITLLTGILDAIRGRGMVGVTVA